MKKTTFILFLFYFNISFAQITINENSKGGLIEAKLISKINKALEQTKIHALEFDRVCMEGCDIYLPSIVKNTTFRLKNKPNEFYVHTHVNEYGAINVKYILRYEVLYQGKNIKVNFRFPNTQELKTLKKAGFYYEHDPHFNAREGHWLFEPINKNLTKASLYMKMKINWGFKNLYLKPFWGTMVKKLQVALDQQLENLTT